MNEGLVMSIIAFIVILAAIIWNFWRIFWKNYYNNLYDNCRREFPIIKERQPYLLKFRLSKYEHTKEFKTQKELLNFCNDYKNNIIEAKSYEISSYDVVQLE